MSASDNCPRLLAQPDRPASAGRSVRLAAASLVLAAAALAAAGPASADRGHRHHGPGFGHGHGHGGPRESIYLGAPAYRPHHYAPPRVFYAPPVYHAPRVIYVPPPVVYAPPVVFSSGVHSSRVYAAPVIVERAPPVYVERNDIASAPPPVEPAASAGNFWFFCTDSNTYYPYVTQCASPWERVTPTPPTAGR